MDSGVIRKAFSTTIVEELEYPEPSISREMSIESEGSAELQQPGQLFEDEFRRLLSAI
jgi:hypothetical protein